MLTFHKLRSVFAKSEFVAAHSGSKRGSTVQETVANQDIFRGYDNGGVHYEDDDDDDDNDYNDDDNDKIIQQKT